MSQIVLQATYLDDDLLLDAVKKVRNEEFHIKEVYTPFPVHGLDVAMGLEKTRLAITAFIYGIIGFCFAIWLMHYTSIIDWPQDLGGKPSFSFTENSPSFIPILFEITVYFAAHLMVITFYMRSKLWPFKKAENPHSKTTDDQFVMEVYASEEKQQELRSLMQSTGAISVQSNGK